MKSFDLLSKFYYDENREVTLCRKTNIFHHQFVRDNEIDSVIDFFNLGDGVFLDIGACVGLYTLFMKFKIGEIHSFEPFRKAFDILTENVKLNNLQNVHLYNMALGDRSETLFMDICDENLSLNTLGNLDRGITSYYRKVKVDTIDNLFMNKRVNFIKIDCEGWEYYILRGGMKVIERDRPIIQLEWNTFNMEQCEVKETDLIQLLKKLNYKLFKTNGEDRIYKPNELTT